MTSDEREISTAALTADGVPSPDGSLDMQRDGEFPPIWRFAVTYRPPAALPRELPALVAESALVQWKSKNAVPEIGLDGQRLALWWLFHHWRHTQSEGPWERGYPEHAALTRALVKAIHLELYQEESWWWEPNHEPTDEERWQRALGRSTEGRDVGELYDIAANVLSQAIEQREAGAEDPLNLPLIEEDPLRGARVHAAYLLARGLVTSGGGRTLEEARDAAYATAASLGA